MRRVILAALIVSSLAVLPPWASANELTEWMYRQTTLDFLADERARDDFEADELPDPGASMRVRMSEVADSGLSKAISRALSPCGADRSERRRLFCWSSYGRNHRIWLPKPAWVLVGALMPHTVWSYKAVDVRFPPSVRVRLPFENATTSFGYEDEQVGMRLRWKF
jgi:hypothetical protein